MTERHLRVGRDGLSRRIRRAMARRMLRGGVGAIQLARIAMGRATSWLAPRSLMAQMSRVFRGELAQFESAAHRTAWFEPMEPRVMLAGDLQVEIHAAPNFIVDSNLQSGPRSEYLEARVTNTGTDTLTNVFVYSGNFGANTPGVYPVTVGSGMLLAENFSLTQVGGATEGTRYVGTIAPGETVSEYFLVSHPWTDSAGTPTFGAQADPADDLVLNYNMWAKAVDPVDGALTTNASATATMRSEISAMANKISPNTDSKVPQAILDAFQEQLGWRPDQVAPSLARTEGVWYDMGRVEKGYDADGNLVPDFDVWMQPVGDPTSFSPGAWRLTHSYGALIVKLNDGTDLIQVFEDELYHKDLPANNTGVVGLVFYEFAPVGVGPGTLSPYQEAASGSNNEKFNGDFGAGFGGSPAGTPPNVTFDKKVSSSTDVLGFVDSGDTVAPGGVLTFHLTATAVDQFFLDSMPGVFSDAIPAGTQYVGGSAIASSLPAGVTAQVLYSTNGGVSWSTTEPGVPSTVTNLQWWLSEPLLPTEVGTMQFQVTVPLGYASGSISNTGGVGLGGSTAYETDSTTTYVSGVRTISGKVYKDDGAGGGTAGDGIENGTESTIANKIGNITVTLYLDSNGNGTIDTGDVVRGTTSSSAVDGTWTFANLPAGNYVALVDRADADRPSGYQLSSAETFAIVVAGADIINKDFGFSPTLDIVKSLSGSSPILEGTYVTYNINATDLLKPAGYVNTQSVVTSQWFGTVSGTFTNPGNAAGAPNSGFATSATTAQTLVGSNLGATAPSGTVVNVQAAIQFQSNVVFRTSDSLSIAVQKSGVGVGTVVLTASELDAFVSAAGLVTVDVTGLTTWTAADFAASNTGFTVTFTRGGGGGAPTASVDAMGFRVTTGSLASTAADVYWTDAQGTNDSFKFSPGASEVNAVLGSASTVSPLDVAFDTTNGQVYQVYATGSVVRSNADGSNRTTLVTMAGNGTSAGIAVDPAGGYMYWTNNSTGGSAALAKVYRAKLDGTGMTSLSPSNPPSSIAVDPADGHVYWSEVAAGNLIINRADLSLSGQTTVFNSTTPGISGNSNPTDLEVDPTHRKIYFTDQKSGNNEYIGVMDYTGTNFTSLTGTNLNSKTPTGMAIDLTNSILYWAQAGGTTGIYKATVNLTSPAPTLSGTAVLTGLPSIKGVETHGAIVSTSTGTYDAHNTLAVVPLVDTYDPAKLQFVSSSITPDSVAAGTITWNNVGPINPGITKTISVTFLVLQPAGNLQDTNTQNTATVTSPILADGLPANNDTDTVTVTVNPAAVIGNRVWSDKDADGVDDAGEPGIPGVTMQLWDSTNTFLLTTTTTDSTGAYQFRGIVAGTYIVKVLTSTLPGTFTPRYDADGTGSANQSTLTISTAANPADNLGQDFGYSILNIFNGTVWQDYNNDGTRQTTDVGLSGVTVRLRNAGDTADVATTTTDINGYYRFTGVANGSYHVRVDSATLPAGYTWAETSDPDATSDNMTPSPAGSPQAVTGGDVKGPYDFGYHRSGTSAIGDAVFYDWNGNNVQNSGDEGIPNVTVSIYEDTNANNTLDPYTDPLVGTAVTNASGIYGFSSLAAGRYIVLVSTTDTDFPSNVAASTTNPAVVNLAAATTNNTVDFGYKPQGVGVLSGNVWYDQNGDQVKIGGSEVGLPSVTVTLLADLNNDGNYVTITTANTDSSGNYSFTGLPVVTNLALAKFRIVVDAADTDIPLDVYGYRYEATTATTFDRTLTSASSSGTANFGFGALGVIGDYIFYDTNANGTQDWNESGISGVTVRLYNNSSLLATTTTDTDGFFLFTGLTPDSTLAAPYSAGLISGATNAGPIVITSAGHGLVTGNIVSITGVRGDTAANGVFTITRIDNDTFSLDGSTGNGAYDFGGTWRSGGYSVVVDTSVAPFLSGFANPPGVAGALAAVADPDRDGTPSWDNTYPSLPHADNQLRSLAMDFGVEYTGADFGYWPVGTVGDYIWRDQDGDGIQGSGELGLNNVAVSITNGVTTYNTNSDFDGLYSFAGLTMGTWTITVTPPGGMTPTFSGSLNDLIIYGNGSVGANSATLTVDASGNITQINGSAISNGSMKIDFGYKSVGVDAIVGKIVLEQQGMTDGNSGEGTDIAADGVNVFLYDNSNSLLGSTTTDALGQYVFSGLPAGTYKVSMSANVSLLDNTVLTTDNYFPGSTPASSVIDNGTSAYQTITISGVTTGVDFAWVSTVTYDLGDLPDSYDTTLQTDGARHTIVGSPTLYLGATAPDAEANGVPSVGATSDDFSGSDDEDGVSVSGAASWGEGADPDNKIHVDVNGMGWLVGWIDFNNDGDFLDFDDDGDLDGPDEMIISQSVTTGSYDFLINVPAGSLPGGVAQLNARFRLFDAQPLIPQLAFQGVATGGEVEDYSFVFGTPGSVGDTVWYDQDNDGAQDTNEPGIEGATVTVKWYGANNVFGGGDDVDFTTTTLAGGAYLITGLPSGNYGVAVSDQPNGLTTASTANVSTFALGAGQNRTDIDLGFRGAVTGATGNQVWFDQDVDGVKDADEPGIEGAIVDLIWAGVDGSFVTDTDNLTLTTTTDSSGLFSFSNLASGGYRISVTNASLPTGLNTPTYDLDGTGTANKADGALAIGETRNDFDFGYRGTASIGDRLWDDQNGDGVQDPNEPGISGATVELVWAGQDSDFTTLDDNLTLSTTSGANGLFGFANLGEDLGNYYRISVTNASLPRDLTTPTYDLDGTGTADTVDMSLAAGTTRTDADFGYRGTASIAGKLWNDTDASGAQNGVEPDISGATVNLVWAGVDGIFSNADDLTLSTTTSGAGAYSFSNLGSGAYTISVVPASLPVGVTTPTYDFDGTGTPNIVTIAALAIAPPQTGVDFGYVAGGTTIGDLVWDDQNNNGTQDANEPGISGATVTLTWYGPDTVLGGGDDQIYTTTTGASGDYSFTVLQGGNYEVAVSAQPNGLTVPSTGNISTFVVVVGVDRSDIDLGFRGGASIDGKLWNDINGNGTQNGIEPDIVGATVLLVWAGQDGSFLSDTDNLQVTTTTDATGAYSFDHLGSGKYIVTVVPATLGGLTIETYDFDGTLTPDSADIAALGIGATQSNVDFGYKAAVTPAFPTPVKSIASTSEAATLGNYVAIGEVVRYRLRIEVPEASYTNVNVHDYLPAGLQYLGNAKIAFSSTTSGNITSSTLSGAGLDFDGTTPIGNVVPTFAITGAEETPGGGFIDAEDVIFDLGNIANSESDVDAEYIVIEFNALVLNDAGITTHSAIFDVQANSVAPVLSNFVVTTVAQPLLELHNVVVTNGSGTFGNNGNPAVYTFTVLHNYASRANAYDLDLSTTIPVELTGLTITQATIFNSISHVTTDVSSSFTLTGAGPTDLSTVGNIDLLTTDTLTIKVAGTLAGVVQGVNISDLATLTWTGLNGLTGTTSNVTGSDNPGPSGSTTGERTGTGAAVNTYSDQDTSTINTPSIDYSNVSITYTPTTYAPGETATASVTYVNSGTTQGAAHTVRLYRTYDPVFNPLTARLLGSVDALRLNPGSRTVSFSWTTTLEDSNADNNNDGTASSYLYAVIDEGGAAPETDENNNTFRLAARDYTVAVPVVSILPDGVSGSDLNAEEGETNGGKFVLERTGSTRNPLTVTVAFTGAGTSSAADFTGGKFPTAATSAATTTTVTFKAGSATATINVTAIVDSADLAPETLIAAIVPDLSNPVNYTLGVDTQTMNITGQLPTVDIVVPDSTATEQKQTTGTFRVSRRTGQPDDVPLVVRVDFAVGSTATLNTDYKLVIDGVITTLATTYADITIPANQKYVDFKVLPVEDSEQEFSESVVATIQSDPAYNVGIDHQTVNIEDNDTLNIRVIVKAKNQTLYAPTRTGPNKIPKLQIVVTNTESIDSLVSTFQVRLVAAVQGRPLNQADFDNSPYHFQIEPLPLLRAGKSRKISYAIRLSFLDPLPLGVYYAAVHVDHGDAMLNERSETDNYGYTLAQFTIADPPVQH